MRMNRREWIAGTLATGAAAQDKPFQWPGGKRAAVSLTFDDARLSQIDTGLALLEKLDVKATFYLSPARMQDRLNGWKKATAAGHEIANHSGSHACTANYRFSKNNALEDYTLESMAADIDRATAQIRESLGVKTVSFAYPCGQQFVGRGVATRSYIPLVAERFLSGRGYLNEAANDPAVCDLANLMGTAFDDMPFAQMRAHVETALKEGRWLVFVGHEIGERGYQTTRVDALAELCAWLKAPSTGVWLDTVKSVAGWVKEHRV